MFYIQSSKPEIIVYENTCKNNSTKDFQFLEFFAGSRMATKCVAGAGYRATCIDIQDHVHAGYACGEGSVFDINSCSGMVLLDMDL